LDSLQFNEIRIWLEASDKQKKVVVNRINSINSADQIKYKLGRETFSLPLISRESESRRRGAYIQNRQFESIDMVRKLLHELVNISWISVHRDILADEFRENRSVRTMNWKNPVDRRIDDITNRFTQYQLQLQSDINKLSDTFRKNVLESMLFSENFDKINITEFQETDLMNIKNGLLRTYQELGILNDTISQRIEEHISKIGNSLDIIKARRKNSKASLRIDDVLPLSLLKRTQYIVTLSAEVENNKKLLTKNVDKYIEILKQFASDKKFILDTRDSGEIMIQKNKTIIPLSQLSSGEKQLFILLTETLLQRDNPFLFIADEPELSLHIKWQRNILESIRALNPNSQIIVATHSPEIAGHWRPNIIKMESMIYV
jgi:predicted ATP-binding protein involved in virulence